MINDDDDENPINIDKLRKKNQNDKLKKMMRRLRSPKQKNSAEIIQLNPSGDLDFTQSDLYADVQDEAYFEGYNDAEENLKEQLDAVQKELEKVRSLLTGVKHIVSVAY